MTKLVTNGDTVRLKSTGDLYVMEKKRSIAGVEFLTLSRHGHMSGTAAPLGERLNVRRDEVVLQRLQCELVDAE
jgi:hypothetical protein